MGRKSKRLASKRAKPAEPETANDGDVMEVDDEDDFHVPEEEEDEEEEEYEEDGSSSEEEEEDDEDLFVESPKQSSKRKRPKKSSKSKESSKESREKDSETKISTLLGRMEFLNHLPKREGLERLFVKAYSRGSITDVDVANSRAKFYPIPYEFKEARGVRLPEGSFFDGLNLELMRYILHYVPFNDMMTMILLTCKGLRELRKDELLFSQCYISINQVWGAGVEGATALFNYVPGLNGARHVSLVAHKKSKPRRRFDVALGIYVRPPPRRQFDFKWVKHFFQLLPYGLLSLHVSGAKIQLTSLKGLMNSRCAQTLQRLDAPVKLPTEPKPFFLGFPSLRSIAVRQRVEISLPEMFSQLDRARGQFAHNQVEELTGSHFDARSLAVIAKYAPNLTKISTNSYSYPRMLPLMFTSAETLPETMPLLYMRKVSISVRSSVPKSLEFIARLMPNLMELTVQDGISWRNLNDLRAQAPLALGDSEVTLKMFRNLESLKLNYFRFGEDTLPDMPNLKFFEIDQGVYDDTFIDTIALRAPNASGKITHKSSAKYQKIFKGKVVLK